MRYVRVRVTVEQHGTDIPHGTASIVHEVTGMDAQYITAIATKSAMALTMGILTNTETPKEDHEHGIDHA